MKKILLPLIILSFPTSLYAQNAREKAYQETINKTAERFYPVICKEGLPEAVKVTQKCYTKAKNGSVGNLECLIFNKYIIDIINLDNGIDPNLNPGRHKDLTQIYPKEITDFINQYPLRLEFDFLKSFSNPSFSLSSYDLFIKQSVQKMLQRIDYLEAVKRYQKHLEPNICIKNIFSKNNFWILNGLNMF